MGQALRPNLMQIPIIPAGGLDGRTRALLIDRYKPTALACTPSYALHLALLWVRWASIPPRRRSGFFSVEASLALVFLRRVIGSNVRGTPNSTNATAAPRRRLRPGGFTCHHIAGAKDGAFRARISCLIRMSGNGNPNTLKVVPEGQRGISVVTNFALRHRHSFVCRRGLYCSFSPALSVRTYRAAGAWRICRAGR